MPIVGNRYYNDAALGQGFSNLAAAFAPPSGADASGYALAAQRKMQNDIIARLRDDPAYADFDHQAALADLYDPNASYYAVDQNNATQRYGYDQSYKASRENNADTVAATRYGYDQTFNASRLNNADTNATSITMNDADNEAIMRKAVLDAATAPVAADAIRPGFNPGDYGVSGVPAVSDFAGRVSPMTLEEVKGAILTEQPANVQTAAAVADGAVESVMTKNGPRVAYRTDSVGQVPFKPLTLAEQQAQERQILIDAGLLTPEMQLDTARMEGQTPVQVVEDGVRKYVPSGEAVRTGATPFLEPKGAPETQNYRTVDGKTGKAFFDGNDNTWKDTTPPHEIIPKEAITFNTTVQGGVNETINPKPTETSDKAGNFYSRAAPASAALDAAIAGDPATGVAPYLPSDADYEATLGMLAGAPNWATRHIVSPEGRKFYDNAQNFMMAMLRPDTGAAFGKDEFQSYARVFIPMPGDTPEVIANKAQARATALAALQGTARGADVAIAKIMQEQGLPVPPEMAAVIARGGVRSGDPGTGAVPAGTSDLPVISDPAEAMKLGSGAHFLDPEGIERVVP